MVRVEDITKEEMDSKISFVKGLVREVFGKKFRILDMTPEAFFIKRKGFFSDSDFADVNCYLNTIAVYSEKDKELVNEFKRKYDAKKSDGKLFIEYL